MNLQKIYYFIKIVETLSLKKAADELFVTRQALSKQIQQLEEELDVTLLERATNHVVVTEAGRKLYALYKPIILEVENAKKEMNRFLQYKKQYIKIGYFSSLPYAKLIEPLVQQLKSELPESHVNLIAAEIGIDRELIMNDSVDLLVTHTPYPEEWDNVEMIPICKKKMKIIVSDKHKWYERDDITAADIAQEMLLVFGNRPIFVEHSFMPEIKAYDRIVAYNSNSYMANLKLGEAFGIVTELFAGWEDSHYKLINLPEELASEAMIYVVLKPFHPLANHIRNVAAKLKDNLNP